MVVRGEAGATLSEGHAWEPVQPRLWGGGPYTPQSHQLVVP